MRYIFEIPQSRAEKISSYIEQGRYESFQDFFEVAVENQLFIESRELGFEPEPQTEKTGSRADSSAGKKTSTRSISEIQELGNRWTATLKPVEPPDLENMWSKYLWGHYNRLLPAKVTLRVLANLLGEQENLNLILLQERASDAAVSVGTYLKALDKKAQRKRWEGLSIGFPNSVKDIAAISRFKLQFVGYVTKQGVLHGMPVALRFMNIIRNVNGKDSQVGITQTGIDFAKLTNPVLDLNQKERTLSNEEIAFYIKHVRNAQPYEMKAFEAVIEAIENGQITYDSLKNQVSLLEKRWSGTIVNTMCTGILSRMRELGVIRMQREGLRSHYELGPNIALVKST